MSSALAAFTVECPSCDTGFPVDPGKVPEGGIYAICSECDRTFFVSRPEGTGPEEEIPGIAAPFASEERTDGHDPGSDGEEGIALDAPASEDVEETTYAGPAPDFEPSTATELAEREVDEPPPEVPAADEAEEGFTFAEPAAGVEEEVTLDEIPEGGFEEDVTLDEVAEGGLEEATILDETAEKTEEESFHLTTEETSEPESATAPEVAGSGADDRAATQTTDEKGEAEREAEASTSFEDLRGLASEAVAEGPGSTGEPGGATLSGGAERFGRRDPADRARRLARVLVSDIIAYYPERFQESRARGTVKEDFEDEVEKSRKEYVDQVGEEMAESTPYFTEALNEILAGGQEIF